MLPIYSCPVLLQPHQTAQEAGFNGLRQRFANMNVRLPLPLMRREPDVNGDEPVLSAVPDTVTSIGELLHAAADPQDERKLVDVCGVRTLAKRPEKVSECQNVFLGSVVVPAGLHA